MQLKLFSLSFCFILFQILAAQTNKQDYLDQFVNTRGLEHASIGFCVKNYSGNIVSEYNKDKSYTPASTLKLVTTAAAFELLGAQYRYKTLLGKDVNSPNRLLIIGSGDPTLGSEHLNDNQFEFIGEWCDAIKKTFTGTKELDIVVVDNLFGYQGVSRKWLYEDIGNHFASGAYGISIFDNRYSISFNTTKRGATPEIVETAPKMKDIHFTNTLTLNTTGQDNGYILGYPFSKERTIIGDIPANRKKFTIKGDIPDPGLFLGETIADTLSALGFQIGKTRSTREEFLGEMYKSEKTVNKANVFYTHTSPSLAEIVRVINEKSNNHYTEHLIRTIGRQKNKNIYSSALEEGIDRVKGFWEMKGLDSNSLFMYDGCGLAPSNAVSAEFMCDVLLYMQTKSGNSVAFLNSLPLAGRDGTVRNLLKGSRLEGKVYVKSGSIANVQCYAGYYIEGDKKYTFSIMVNNYHTITRREVIKAIERLLLGVLN